MKPRLFLAGWVLIHLSTSAMALDLKLAVPIPGPVTIQYIAETSARARVQGVVTAGGVPWGCVNNRCTVTRPWSPPSVESCQSLAALVGPMRSFGHQDAQLNGAQLAQCNAGIPAARPFVKGSVVAPIPAAAPQKAGVIPPKPIAVPPKPLTVSPKPAAVAPRPPRTVTSKDFAPLALPTPGTNIDRVQVVPQHQLGPKAAEVTFGDGQPGSRPPSGAATTYRATPEAPKPPVTKSASSSPVPAIQATPPMTAPAFKPPPSVLQPAVPTQKSFGKPSKISLASRTLVINAKTLRYAGRGNVVINANTLRYAGRSNVVITTDTLRYAGRGNVVFTSDTLRYAGLANVTIRTDPLRYLGTKRR